MEPETRAMLEKIERKLDNLNTNLVGTPEQPHLGAIPRLQKVETHIEEGKTNEVRRRTNERWGMSILTILVSLLTSVASSFLPHKS